MLFVICYSYLEQLSQRYKLYMDNMYHYLNQTINKLANTTESAEARVSLTPQPGSCVRLNFTLGCLPTPRAVTIAMFSKVVKVTSQNPFMYR